MRSRNEPSSATFRASATGVMMGMREYSYSVAILSMAMALDDQNFLGAESERRHAPDRLGS
jgi:3-dehydroquinate dehydratase II